MFNKFFGRAGVTNQDLDGGRAELGRAGEDMAVKYLKKKGYRIVERNFSGRFGEIDIIVRCRDLLVFVEVKTRSSKGIGTPKEAVDFRKAGRIIKAAQEYMQKKALPEDTALRFDVIGITIGGDQAPEIEHIEAAFDAL